MRCEEQDVSLVAALEAKHVYAHGSLSGGGGSGGGGGTGVNGEGNGSAARSLRDHLVAVVVTIAVFCEAHPPFSARHLTVLLPYLKGTIHSLTHSLTYSLTHSLIHLLTHSLIHLLTHSLTHSPSHSLTHLLTHDNTDHITSCQTINTALSNPNLL